MCGNCRPNGNCSCTGNGLPYCACYPPHGEPRYCSICNHYPLYTREELDKREHQDKKE